MVRSTPETFRSLCRASNKQDTNAHSFATGSARREIANEGSNVCSSLYYIVPSLAPFPERDAATVLQRAHYLVQVQLSPFSSRRFKAPGSLIRHASISL